MGNLCSKSPSKADNDPFAQPGRVLGSAPSKPSEPRAQIPKTSQGQRLGTNNNGGSTIANTAGDGGGGGGGGGGDARTAAAKAAEDRFAKSQQRQNTGKLARDLASQKAMTRNDTLNSISQDERRMRDADEGSKLRSYE